MSSIEASRLEPRARRTQPSAADYVIASTLAVLYVVWLSATVEDLGYARDEGFYFAAAQSYERWFELLGRDFAAALERANVDPYWTHNHEHPALMKSLFALSRRYLHDGLGLFAEQGSAYRFPGMVVSSLAIAVVYLWGRELLGRAGALVAALLLALMPRVFYHSHLACFDMPVAAMWLVTTYAYARSLNASGVGWVLAAAVLYGLLLDTKHNSWLLPFALVFHLGLTRGRTLLRELRAGRIAVPRALPAMALIGPLVFYALWPWIWNDTGKRLGEYVAFHTGHEYYNMEFLGRTYWKPPMPRLYAWVMTLATVPGITLVLFGIGFAASTWHAHGAQGVALARRASSRFRITLSRAIEPARPDEQRYSSEALWAVCLLVSYAPWFSNDTPIFGGTKHWITAYPFLCLFAGRGFVVTAAALQQAATPRLARWLDRADRKPAAPRADGLDRSLWWGRRAVAAALGAAVLAGPLAMTVDSHPWGLSFYTPLVGGSSGAANLGLNRTFWGYTTGAVQDFVNRRAPKNATVFVSDTALQSWDMMRKDGRIRADLRGTLSKPSSNLALYHHETHMRRVEQQIWVEYGTVRPSHFGIYHGVPIVWIYERPPAKAAR